VSHHDLENWSITSLLDELDEASSTESKKREEGAHGPCRRRHGRHVCRRDCKVRYVAPGCGSIVCLEGRMRNLSQGGVSLLVRRSFVPGEAIEVEVDPPIKDKVFLAGLIRFCRYVGNGYYEVGIEFKAVSARTLFTNDPFQAKRLATAWKEQDLDHEVRG